MSPSSSEYVARGLSDNVLCNTCKSLILNLNQNHNPSSFRLLHLRWDALVQSAGDGCPTFSFVVTQFTPNPSKYDLNISGDSSRQSCIQWSSSLKLELYEPGKLAVADDRLEHSLDASRPNSNLNCEFTKNSLEVYTPEYIEQGPNVQYDVSPRTNDDTCFQLIKKWIECCSTLHLRCGKPENEPMLPTRVSDVTKEGSDPFLKETKGAYGKYVTLSHRWPDVLISQTTTKSLNNNHRAIALADMPSPFQDTVDVCRKLGIQYLWIDSLCIVQDSNEDWAAEAAQMGLYYSNALFTIAALQDHSKGLYSSRSAPSSIPFESPIPDKSPPKILALRKAFPSLDFELLASSLDSRGWVFQERLLSRAILHFGPNQLFWECRTVISPECSKPTFHSLRSLTYRFGRWLWLARKEGEYAMGEWQEIRLFVIFPNTKVTAGIWHNDVYKQLLWAVESKPDLFNDGNLFELMFLKPTNMPDEAFDVAAKPRSPTWSWISVDYPIAAYFNDNAGTGIKVDSDFTVTYMDPREDILKFQKGSYAIELGIEARVIGVPSRSLEGKSNSKGTPFQYTLPNKENFVISGLTGHIDPGIKVPKLLWLVRVANTDGVGMRLGYFLILDAILPWEERLVLRELVELYEVTGGGILVTKEWVYKRIGIGWGPKEYVDEVFQESMKHNLRIV
ncbi:uncharacterized protein PAC_01231 [Phialocephala subalpina]|uniref:Heterokaryon incompatibility domain-containing protein n=1 Tax=Phialocephala subalpina TaxID=576137 RepID=A0A1L7WF18_9HELO|nr:uncharacterized protein PAC_01231 [Phialocephala subalpina]